MTKDHRINLDHIVNLKKKNSEIPKAKNKGIKPYYQPTGTQDTTLIFESRFESGNLLASFKITEESYQLVLHHDTNTSGYIHWFYFRVSNMKKGMKVNMNILNNMRKFSMHMKGMRILIYSEKKAEQEKIGWHRGGENIHYYHNSMYSFIGNRKRLYYSLSFDYEFEYDSDLVYFTLSMPCSYTDVMRQLNEYQKDEVKYPFFHRKLLCSTLAGNDLDYFTINSSNSYNNTTLLKTEADTRQGIVLMARAHPGETVGSWMIKGAIEFLMGESDEARYLRENFLIKIIPMMNPDGVIMGNSRTSFAGCDLNRRWANPNEVIHPEVYFAKQMILKMASQRKMALICDFHGHSGCYNSFFYCNHMEDNPSSCKIFPFLASKLSNIINFDQCCFTMPKCKYGTARINLFHELELPNIVTLESSFIGCTQGKYKDLHFTTSHLLELGREVCISILSYHYNFEQKICDFPKRNSTKSSTKNIITIDGETQVTLSDSLKKENKLLSYQCDQDSIITSLLGHLAKKEALKKESQEEGKLNGESNSESESESEPSLDNLETEQIMKLLPTQAKKKKRKIKKNRGRFLKLKQLSKAKQMPPLIQDTNLTKVPATNRRQTKANTQYIAVTNNSPVNNANQFQKDNPGLSTNNPNPQISEKDSSNSLIGSSENQVNSIIVNVNIEQKKASNCEEKKDSQFSTKKDAETQTEDVYFKMHWSYFLGTHVILTARSLVKYPQNRKSNSLEKKLYNNSIRVSYVDPSRSQEKLGSLKFHNRQLQLIDENVIRPQESLQGFPQKKMINEIKSLNSNNIYTHQKSHNQLDINLTFNNLMNTPIIINQFGGTGHIHTINFNSVRASEPQSFHFRKLKKR